VVLIALLLTIAFVSLSFVNSKNPEEKYIIVVGVADYPGVANDLNYSDDDAVLFYKKMRRLGVKRRNSKLLLNKKATQRNIVKKMKALFSKADENDGHCWWDPKNDELWLRVLYCDWMPNEGWIKQNGINPAWFKPAVYDGSGN